MHSLYQRFEKMYSIVLVTILVSAMCLLNVNDVQAAVALYNPRSVTNTSLASGRGVTWDCVYFGSYPQSEVKSSDSVYSTLTSSTGWSSSGDLTVNGTKYRRIQSSDATYVGSGSDYYSWDSKYHYFKYEPIKWRVLSVSSNQAFLLSDQLLDDQYWYPSDTTNIVWSNSSMRTWLNNTFYEDAFTSEEQAAIPSTTLVNTTSYTVYSDYSVTFGGSSTSDKVFLLSRSEASNLSYGFADETIGDEGRVAKSTEYARAMGVQIYSGYSGYWWLRSNGSAATSGGDPKGAVAVEPAGTLNTNGYTYDSYAAGARPAVYIDLSKTSVYTSAGTVYTGSESISGSSSGDSSGGSTGGSTTGGGSSSSTGESEPTIKTQTITASNKSVAYKSASFKLEATTDGDGKLSYSSSNKKVATISSNGTVSVKNYGTTTITITASATSTYDSATKKITISVVPKKMSVKSVSSPAKTKLKVTWRKNSTVSGYTVQFSKDSSFKKEVFQKNFSMKTTSTTVKGLSRKKNYYVRIRAYKKVSGKVLYGAWSYGRVQKIK